jgi:hypothetical protein
LQPNRDTKAELNRRIQACDGPEPAPEFAARENFLAKATKL